EFRPRAPQRALMLRILRLLALRAPSDERAHRGRLCLLRGAPLAPAFRPRTTPRAAPTPPPSPGLLLRAELDDQRLLKIDRRLVPLRELGDLALELGGLDAQPGRHVAVLGRLDRGPHQLLRLLPVDDRELVARAHAE